MTEKTNKPSPITVVIADDHAILRSGLRMMLNAQPDIRVVGEAENGDEALQQTRVKKPDILLLDISMPDTGGIEVIEAVRISTATRILVLTMHAEPGYLESALQAGASGYVLKRALDADLLKAIRLVHQGDTFVDPHMTGHLVERSLGVRTTTKVSPAAACEGLSRRERQVLTLVAQGYTNQDIATRIFVSVKSVETYRARVQKKLHCKNRPEMVRFAIAAGLLPADMQALK